MSAPEVQLAERARDKLYNRLWALSDRRLLRLGRDWARAFPKRRLWIAESMGVTLCRIDDLGVFISWGMGAGQGEIVISGLGLPKLFTAKRSAMARMLTEALTDVSEIVGDVIAHNGLIVEPSSGRIEIE